MWYLVIAVVALAIGYAAQPKAQTPNIKSGVVESPRAEEGSNIPVLFGRRMMRGANTVWTGDIKAVAIKKKGGKK